MKSEKSNPNSFFVLLQNVVVNPLKKAIFDLQTSIVHHTDF
jgi:hypothetical protein